MVLFITNVTEKVPAIEKPSPTWTGDGHNMFCRNMGAAIRNTIMGAQLTSGTQNYSAILH
jgi:hypothetical protein